MPSRTPVTIVSGFEAGRTGHLVRRCPSGAVVVWIDGYPGPVTLSPNDVHISDRESHR